MAQPCNCECPAVPGVTCTRFRGHRDAHSARLLTADGREVRLEWTIYDNRMPAAPRPLET